MSVEYLLRAVIQKSEQQDIDRAGRRILRGALEPLGWVLNGIDEDYGIDYDVQVFVDGSPNGIWFKVQLKSSAGSDYSANGDFISQALTLDHAKQYATELHEPIFLIHADTVHEKVFWCAPQLDDELLKKIGTDHPPATVTLRIPTANALPATAEALVQIIEQLYVVLANRALVSASVSSFADALKYQPGEDKLREEFQRKNDTLRLRNVAALFRKEQYEEARSRACIVATDPDASIENKFWAETQIGAIDWADAVRRGRPQNVLAQITLENSKRLRSLTQSGPPHLKFFAVIAKKAAELEVLARDNWGLTILLLQHSRNAVNPFMALNVYAAHAHSTKRMVAKYNQCLRLASYAANFRGRWALPRALLRIVQSSAFFIARVESKALGETGNQFSSSALQICKLMAWIAEESGDEEAIALAISAAMMTVKSPQTEAFKWGSMQLDRMTDPDAKREAIRLIERHLMRWRGEQPEGDYNPDPMQQIVENAAASLGIDPTDGSNPIMQGLRIAARDNTPARVLQTCEHIVATRGATGPVARRIQILFGIETASSKVVHCTLHNYHHEGRDLDSAFAQFRSDHCDSCPDRSPRPSDWEYSEQFREEFEAKHLDFVNEFNATGAGFRLTAAD